MPVMVRNLRWYSAKRFLALVAVVVVLAASVGAAVVQHPKLATAATLGTINFQARLMTNTGAIAPDGNYNVEFKLYDTPTTGGTAQGVCTGNCKWVETRTSTNYVSVANGYLTVNLGSVTPFGSTINWDQDLYITMNIGGTGGSPTWDGEMSPRLKLTAVPYAFRAGALAGGTGANTTVLDTGTPTGTNTLHLPAETGTLCVQGASTCGFAPTSGSGNYIQNGTSIQTANFAIRSAANGSIGAVIQGSNGQSVDLLDVQTWNGSSATTVLGVSSAGLVTVSAGLTATGAIQLNSTGSGATTIGNTTSGGALTIGSIQASSITVNGNTLALSANNFSLNSAGVLSLAGGQTIDITTPTASSATALTVQPGTSSGASSNGPALIVSGGDGSGTTSVTGGGLTLRGGSATGGSGTRNGGSVSIDAGTGASANGSISIGSVSAAAIGIGRSGITTTVTGALTSAGGAILLNDSSNNNTSINTGTSTGQVSIGNAAAGAISLQSGSTIAVTTTNFNVSTAGVVTLAGGQTADITTGNAATATAITLQPGTSSGASSNGPAVTIKGGNGSGTTNVTGGTLTLQGGNATGGSGSRTGGNVSIDAGTGASANGTVSIGGVSAIAIGIGRSGITTTVTGAFTSAGGTILLNNNSNNDTSINTGTSTGQVSIGNAAAGALSLQSGSTIAITTTNFNVSTAGVVTLLGGQTSDITTANATTATAITLQPGTSSGASSNGPAVTIKAGNGSGTTNVTGGTLTLQGGSATGGSGTRNGGSVSIDAGTGGSANGSITIGNTSAAAVGIGRSGITTTVTGAFTSTGGNILLNDSSNNNTSINTGTSTGQVSIGNGAAGAIALQSGSTIAITTTNFNVSTAGVVTLAGGQTADITTAATTTANGITITPGASSGASSNGGGVTIKGSNATGTTNVTGGAITIQGGNATGASGTRVGGSVTIDAGTSAAGAANNGTVSIGTTNATTVTLGSATTVVKVGLLGASTSTAVAVCRDSSTTNLIACGSGGTGAPFLQGGNAFGATGSLGTTDANNLQIITGSSGPNIRATFDTSNNLYLGNGLSAATPTTTFSVLGTASTTAGTAGTKLVLQGGAGTATGTGSAGGDVLIAGGNAGAGSGNNVGGIVTLQGGGRSNTGAPGKVLVKNTTDSATAFQVQNAAGTSTYLDVDTSNGYVGVGTAAPSRQLHVAVNNSTVTSLPVLLEQAGAGDTGIEFKNPSKNFYLGLDATDGALKISSAAAANGTFTVGDTSVESGTDNNPNSMSAYKVTTGASGGTVSSVSMYLKNVDGTNPHVQAAIYADSSGVPGALLGSSATQTATANSWNTFSMSGVTVSATTNYWIAISEDGTTDFAAVSSGGTSAYHIGGGYPALNPFNQNASQLSYKISFYMTVIASGTPDNLGVASLFRMSDTGAAVFQNSVDSSFSFQIQNAAGTSLFTTDTTGSALFLGSTGSSTAASTVHIADTSDATGAQTVTIGSAAANASDLTTIQGGSNTTQAIQLIPNTAGGIMIGATAGTGTITVGRSTASNTISVGSGNPAASATQTINIGNGSQTTASSVIAVNILSGSAGSNGTASLKLANNDRVTQVDIGNVVSDASRSLNIFSGNTLTGTIDTINIGTGNTVGTGSKVVHIADGTPAGTNTVTIGSVAGTANVTTIQGGNVSTGVGSVSIQAATSGLITIGTTNNNPVTLGGASSTIKVGALGASTSTAVAVCRDSSTTTLISCGSGGTGAPFLQGGNSFGGIGVLGTLDANGLEFVTGSSGPNIRASFDTSNNLYLGNASPVTGTAAAPTNFSILGTGSSTGGTAGGNLTVQAGAGNTTAAGGNVTIQGGTSGTGAAAVGGNVTIQGGTGNGTGASNGGMVTLKGGTAAGSAGAAGGAIAVTAGAGTSSGTGGVGGNITLTAGAAGGSGNNNGGNISMVLGAATGTGTQGAFQVQNAVGANLLTVDPSNTAASLNLIANGGAESGSPPTSYAAQGTGSSVATGTGTDAASGSQSAKVTFGTSANAGVKINFTTAPTASTTVNYIVSFSAKQVSGTAISNTLQVVYSPDNGTTLTATCSSYSTQGLSTTAWTKVTCSFIPGSTTVTTALLIIRQTDAPGVSRVIDIDNVSVVQQNSTGTQDTGDLKVGGAISQGLTLFTLDTYAGTPFTGSNSSLAGSMYFDTTAGKIQCYDGTSWGACGAAPNTIVTLTPEYAGAVLHGTPSGSDNNIGTLTSDFCGNGGGLSVNTGLCASGEARNFYKWTSPQSTSQTYTVYVTYKLPSTFKNFVSSTTTATGRVDNTTNAGLAYSIYKSTGSTITSCSASINIVGNGSGSVNTWTSQAPTTDPVNCTFAANNYIIFAITVTSNTNANAYLENLNFSFSNQ